MGDDIQIRPFLPNDQDSAETLILSGLAEHFNSIDPALNQDLKDIEESYLSQGSLFLVAEIGGQLVGTGALLSEAKDTGRIARVSVARSHRHIGIGRLITKHLVDAAHRRTYSKIVVETNDDWHDAIRLYQRCGFSEYDRCDGEVHMVIHL